MYAISKLNSKSTLKFFKPFIKTLLYQSNTLKHIEYFETKTIQKKEAWLVWAYSLLKGKGEQAIGLFKN